MRYIITAKNILNGKEHITDPLERTEICTEMIMPRLKLIELLNTGQVNKNDTIVTRIDRKCLYQNLFDHVIDYSEFASKAESMIQGDTVIDLAAEIYQLDDTMPFMPFYQRFELDKTEIFNIALGTLQKYNVTNPYICLLIRKTPNHPEKNLNIDYWLNFIFEFLDYTLHRVKVFIFGQGLPDILECTPNVHFVSCFQDWCTLLHNVQCKCVVSTTSGGVYPIFFTGNDQSKLVIIDNNRLTEKHADSPSFYHPCINFKKVQVDIIKEVPQVKDLTIKVVHHGNL